MVLKMNYEDIKIEYDRLFYKKITLLSEKNKLRKKIKKENKEIKNLIDTRLLLNETVKIVQKRFKDFIEKTVTGAIQKIFNRDLVFILKYEEKRNEIESKIIIEENGEELDPEDDLGGSIIDIIAFAFKIVLWGVSSPKTRNTFIFDEPFKWTGKLISFTGAIMKELSRTLDFQVIIITHEDELINIADKVFKIEHINGKSEVKVFRKKRML